MNITVSTIEINETTAWIIMGGVSNGWETGQSGIDNKVANIDSNNIWQSEEALIRNLYNLFPSIVNNYTYIPTVQNIINE